MAIKAKNKDASFICVINETHFQLLKCIANSGSKAEFTGFESGAISGLNEAFKRLDYKNNHVIIALPRYLATCRYLKIPSNMPSEIERIVGLQAPRHIPYPAEELITGYQVIQADKEGYAHVNLIIAHKDTVGRYLELFKEIRPQGIDAVLNSYGILGLFNYLLPRHPYTVTVIDINPEQVELVIISRNRMLFSRAFRNTKDAGWEAAFISEINKTHDAYMKEVSGEIPSKIFLFCASKAMSDYSGLIKNQISLPVEPLLIYEKINLSEELKIRMLNSDHSFASLIGLGLEDIPDSISLLPAEIKDKTKKRSLRRRNMRLAVSILGIILILIFATAKTLGNKSRYLRQLRAEIEKVAKDAKPLEDIERMFRITQLRQGKKPSGLDVLYELHQIMPESMSLINLSYEEDKEVILRGQAPELNSVFMLLGELEKSSAFKNFDIKVRYATQRKVLNNEFVDFEILCTKR